MLPPYIDCPRKAAANQFVKLIKDAGYNIPVFKKSKIYAIIGTCTHTASEYLCTQKILNKPISGVEDFTLDKLTSEIKMSENLEYDAISPNQNHVITQLKRFIKIYKNDVLPKIVFPENALPGDYLELYLKAKIKGYNITGHIDLLTKYSVGDTKTGTLLKPCHTQVGGYDLLADANGKTGYVNNIIIHMPRVHKDKRYPGTKIIKLDPGFCKLEAHSLILKIVDDLNKFKKNGDCRSFMANPQSMLCSRKYCKAYGTDFCGYFK
jgi:hypothetical protein